MLFLIVHSTCGFHKEDPISVLLLCEKAIELNEKLGGLADFKACTGWLKNFKSHHGIRELQIEGESLSGDKNSAHKFREIFLQHVKEDGYSRDDVYNIDEIGAQKIAWMNSALFSEWYTKDFIPNVKRVTVAKWYRYRIVACLVTSSSPVPLKTRRVGRAR
ncbi:jerky-like protein [Trichonephila clavipes]|nr:jerky-like protein [Trichonephila clavipes]